MNVLRSLTLAISIAYLSLAQTGVASDRPNIVFIFSDDHAVQAIGAYGSTINKTPHLDRLAREGMIFKNSFCTNSICGPSRASILTGKHSHLNGFRRNGNRFDPSQMTFPKLMQEVGYQTAVIGKWHLGTHPTGFDHWEILPGQGSYYNPDLIQMDGQPKRFEGYVSEIITQHSLEWLENERDEEKPFVLMMQHKAPHRDWSPEPKHFGRYKHGTIPEPDTLFDDYTNRSITLKDQEMTIANHFFWGHDMKFHGENLFPEHFQSGINMGEYARMNDEQKAAWDKHYEPENEEFITKMNAGELSDEEITRWKHQRYMHDYLGSVQSVDDSVGTMLDYLDEAGLAENTIVIYASDQGFYLGEHGWYDKRWMFEESLKMPFIIRWPGKVEAGITSQAMIQNIDYAPTFLEVAETKTPSEIQGRSLMPVLLNKGEEPADWRDCIYYSYYENAAVHEVAQHDGIRTDRYKLMHFPRTKEFNLFDLETDPQEMQSVHDDPAYADILSGMQMRLRDQRRFYDVNFAVIPATRADETWWRNRNREKNEEARSADDFELVFIGDSITQGWEGAGKPVWDQHFGNTKALNLGFGGDRTEHVIWRIEHNQLGANKPKVAVLMIGTNNTGHLLQDPEEVTEGVSKILDLLAEKTPETKVLVLGIFPRGETSHDLFRINNKGINDRIRLLADGDRIHYVALDKEFTHSDGTIDSAIMPDYLHLSEQGYRIWAEALTPELAKLGL